MLAVSLGLVIVSPLSRESTVGILDPTVFREERETDRQAETGRQRDRENSCYWKWWGLQMRQKKSCQVGFIVKATICFMDSDPIRFIIHFIICSKIWIIRIFWVSNAPCSQFIGIMWGSHLSNCLSNLIDQLHLTFGVFMQLAWVPIEVRVFYKTSLKAMNIASLVLMISPAVRELVVV